VTDLSIEDFATWVGEACEVAVDETALPMTLAAVEPLDGSPRETGGFRLEFLGPPEPILGQAIVTVRRPAFDREIFMVPIASGPDGTRYEAVFY